MGGGLSRYAGLGKQLSYTFNFALGRAERKVYFANSLFAKYSQWKRSW